MFENVLGTKGPYELQLEITPSRLNQRQLGCDGWRIDHHDIKVLGHRDNSVAHTDAHPVRARALRLGRFPRKHTIGGYLQTGRPLIKSVSQGLNRQIGVGGLQCEGQLQPFGDSAGAGVGPHRWLVALNHDDVELLGNIGHAIGHPDSNPIGARALGFGWRPRHHSVGRYHESCRTIDQTIGQLLCRKVTVRGLHSEGQRRSLAHTPCRDERHPHRQTIGLQGHHIEFLRHGHHTVAHAHGHTVRARTLRLGGLPIHHTVGVHSEPFRTADQSELQRLNGQIGVAGFQCVGQLQPFGDSAGAGVGPDWRLVALNHDDVELLGNIGHAIGHPDSNAIGARTLGSGRRPRHHSVGRYHESCRTIDQTIGQLLCRKVTVRGLHSEGQRRSLAHTPCRDERHPHRQSVGLQDDHVEFLRHGHHTVAHAHGHPVRARSLRLGRLPIHHTVGVHSESLRTADQSELQRLNGQIGVAGFQCVGQLQPFGDSTGAGVGPDWRLVALNHDDVELLRNIGHAIGHPDSNPIGARALGFGWRPRHHSVGRYHESCRTIDQTIGQLLCRKVTVRGLHSEGQRRSLAHTPCRDERHPHRQSVGLQDDHIKFLRHGHHTVAHAHAHPVGARTLRLGRLPIHHTVGIHSEPLRTLHQSEL